MSDIAIDIVAGFSRARLEEIKEVCSDISGAKIYCNMQNMSSLMLEADLSLGPAELRCGKVFFGVTVYCHKHGGKPNCLL